MHKITSTSNPKFRNACRLHTSRGRRAQGKIIIFGSREVFRCLRLHTVDEVYVTPGLINSEDLDFLEASQENQNFPVYELSTDLFDKLSYGARSDGVVAVAKRPLTELDRLVPGNAGLLVVVEGVEKPGNLGAVVRSADSIGASGVVACGSGTDFFHPNSIRNSMGTVFKVPLAVDSVASVQSWLQQNGIRILLADASAAANFYDQDLRGPTAFVLGNESRGLSDDWTRKPYQSVALPMLGVADSLNVSVTASVMLFEAWRQRNSSSA